MYVRGIKFWCGADAFYPRIEFREKGLSGIRCFLLRTILGPNAPPQPPRGEARRLIVSFYSTAYRLARLILWNCLGRSAVQIGKSPTDFLSPGGLCVGVKRFIEALDKRSGEIGAIPLGQAKSRVE